MSRIGKRSALFAALLSVALVSGPAVASSSTPQQTRSYVSGYFALTLDDINIGLIQTFEGGDIEGTNQPQLVVEQCLTSPIVSYQPSLTNLSLTVQPKPSCPTQDPKPQ